MTQSSRRNATALLLSYDGVWWRSDEAAATRIEVTAGLEPGTLHRLAFAPARSVPAIIGAVSRAAWCESIAAGLVEELGDLSTAEKVVEEWYANRGRPVPEIIDFVADLRASGTPVAVCATGIDDLPDDLAGRVDAVVNAADVGIAVPHPEFFTTAARALATVPSACLYVDTSARNVAGARVAGLLAYRSVGLESLTYLGGVFSAPSR